MHMGVRAVSANTVFQHQSAFLQPAVRDVWQGWQDHYIATTQQLQKPVILGGDGRADSPGHCAKFGVYSLMDLTIMKICIINLVQVRQLCVVIFFITEQGNKIYQDQVYHPA